MDRETLALRRHLLPTGITGLDTILGGGFREASLNLIAGRPGTGKTTLAHQLMFALTRPGRTALYLTALGEPPAKMLRHQEQYSFFRPEELHRSIHFLNLASVGGSNDTELMLQKIQEAVEEHKPSLLFIDSFRSLFAALHRGQAGAAGLPAFLHQMALLMRGWQATTFLVAEYLDPDREDPLFTVADGILWLHNQAEGNDGSRKLEVVKLRGQETLPGLHTFRIGHEGLRVFAPWVNPLANRVPPTGRAETGIHGLDGMLGGGIPRGTSFLVAGPSGSGKTIFADAFLLAGAKAGENSVIAVFEQRPPRLRSPALEKLIHDGRVSMVETGSTCLEVDEIAQLIVLEVDRMNATRVVIDSLSGLEMLLSTTGRARFRPSLARLLEAMASLGVTVVMTAEIEDRHSFLPLSPERTAFLADGILLQRYVEVGSRLLRLLVVAKLRGSWHSNELRQYHIDDDGLQLEEALGSYEGLLGGRPSQRSHALSVVADSKAQ